MQTLDQKSSEPPAQITREAGSVPLPSAAYLDEIETFVNMGRWEWDVATGALTCSQQLLRIYGVASQDMMPSATSFLLRTHQADRTRARACIMRALQTHEPFQFQQRIVRLDNEEVRTLRTRGTVELDAHGKPARVLGFSQDITQLHATDQRAQETLKRAARRTLDREEQDRSRIALRIREDVAEPLLALGRKLAGVGAPGLTQHAESMPPDIDECISIANTVGTNTLRIIGCLQPALLEEQGLLAALRSETLRIGRLAAIPVNVSGEEISPRLPLGVESALLRVAQEALLNASRHSGCTLISVSLTGSAGHIRLEVKDNGCGMDEKPAGASEDKRGLTLMRERAEAISAIFRLSSKPGLGTRVTVDYRA